MAAPELGFEFLDAIEHALALIEHPEMGEREDLTDLDVQVEIRRWVMKRFPFVLYYEPARLRVVAISHTRQRPLYWAKRLRA